MYGRDYLSQIERTGGVEPTWVSFLDADQSRPDIPASPRARVATVIRAPRRPAGIRVLPNLTLECDDGVCAVPQYIRLTDEQARELIQSLIEARKDHASCPA